MVMQNMRVVVFYLPSLVGTQLTSWNLFACNTSTSGNVANLLCLFPKRGGAGNNQPRKKSKDHPPKKNNSLNRNNTLPTPRTPILKRLSTRQPIQTLLQPHLLPLRLPLRRILALLLSGHRNTNDIHPINA